MFKLLVIKAIQVALCQFYGFCLKQDDCPDGVCDDALKAVDSLQETPTPTMAPGTVQSIDFGDIDWTQLKAVSDAVVELIAALKAFFGMDRRVG